MVVVWNYMKYTNNKMVETYESDWETNREIIINKIIEDEELKPVLTMVSVSKLTADENIIQQAYDLAASNNREELVELINSL
jgi:vacuolar-type H+-ATPase catalytic subunit A/Vma1